MLGWALPVLDVAANVAAAELYHHLAAGKRVDEAVALARAALFRERHPDWHLLRLYADATPLTPLVTPPGHRDRARLSLRPAHQEFLDARAKSEVCPRERFVGRRRALQRCLRVLCSAEGEEDHREGVILTGMGGLGKSSLAARLCQRMSGWERLVWVGRVDEAELLRVLTDRLADPGVVEVLNDPRLTLRQRLRSLLDRPLASRPVLFVFDDFEQNVEKDAEGRPRLDSEGRGVLEPAALGILADLLAAVRETASASRVVVTCRYGIALPGPAGLYEEALESLRGADLEKKLGSLPRLAPTGTTDPALRERATGLAAGNPRLLERVNTVLEDEGTDHEAVLAALEGVADRFREETLLKVLLDLQAPEARRLVARVAVYRLPVDREAVAAAAGEVPLDPHLGRVAAVGLVERVVAPEDAEGGRRYFVSNVLAPLLVGEMTEKQRIEVCRRAAIHLHKRWWVETGTITTEDRVFEIYRLARDAGEVELGVFIGDKVAASLKDFSRFREAELLCWDALNLKKDFRVLNTLAMTEWTLGKTNRALRHLERALALCPPENSEPSEEVLKERGAILNNLAVFKIEQHDFAGIFEMLEESLRIMRKVQDSEGEAATLHAMGSFLVRQGQLDRAFDFFERSLHLYQNNGSPLGTAATLQAMASLLIMQGQSNRGLDLLRQSLAIAQQTGDVKGYANTLQGMADFFSKQGQLERALQLSEQSLKLLEEIGDARGRASTLLRLANILALQGQFDRAFENWTQALSLEEAIGNVQEKAATLANMAWAAGQQGDQERQRQLNLEAVAALASIRAWVDVVRVLKNLGASQAPDSLRLLAQAFWLAARSQAPLEDILSVAAGLLYGLGLEADAAPLVAAAAVALTRERHRRFPQPEEVLNRAFRLLEACAGSRQVPEDQFQTWAQSLLSDPARLFADLDRALEAIVGEDGWLFDRALVVSGREG